jgi:hypothetical protein
MAMPRRVGDDRIAGDQAALWRVATLVARIVPPGLRSIDQAVKHTRATAAHIQVAASNGVLRVRVRD